MHKSQEKRIYGWKWAKKRSKKPVSLAFNWFLSWKQYELMPHGYDQTITYYLLISGKKLFSIKKYLWKLFAMLFPRNPIKEWLKVEREKVANIFVSYLHAFIATSFMSSRIISFTGVKIKTLGFNAFLCKRTLNGLMFYLCFFRIALCASKITENPWTIFFCSSNNYLKIIKTERY